MTALVYGCTLADETIQSVIDPDGLQMRSLARWPAFIEPSGDNLFKAIGTLMNMVQAARLNDLSHQELGGLRLLRRLTNNLVKDDPRQAALEQMMREIPLGGGYSLMPFGPAMLERAATLPVTCPSRHFGYDDCRRFGPNGHVGWIDNASFLLVKQNSPVLAASAVAVGLGLQGHIDAPIQPLPLVPADPALAAALAQALHLLPILYGTAHTCATEINTTDLCLYKALRKRGCRFTAELHMNPVIDLTRPVADLYADMRISNKPHINWGQKNLVFTDYTGAGLTDAIVEQLWHSLSRLRAEQIARYGNHMPRNSFDYSVALCRQGHGHLTMARDATGQLVGNALIIDEDGMSYYKEGASEHRINGKAPSFAVLWHAILQARQRGMRRFLPNRLIWPPVAHYRRHACAWEDWRWGQHEFKEGFSSKVETGFVYGF